MTDQPTSNITLHNSCYDFGEEIIRIDKEGFHYQGQFISDVGEAHCLMVEFLRQNTRPEPQGPTDEELQELASGFFTPTEFHFVDFARAALTRWGRPAIEPVSVTERLPGPEDCDAEGRCWLLTVEDDYPQWRLHSIQGAQPGGYMIWVPVDSDGTMVDCFYTSHWLPAHALPMPQQEAE